MKKRGIVETKAAPSKRSDAGLGPLIAEVRGLIQSARQAAATAVNTLQVMTNFEIGRRIVEHEQKGAKRAAYGTELLKELSARLTEEFGSGFSERNLEYMRKFYLARCNRSSSKKARTMTAAQVAFKSPFFLSFFKEGSGLRHQKTPL